MQYMMFYQYYLHIFEAFNSKWRLFSIVKIKSPQSLQDKKTVNRRTLLFT